MKRALALVTLALVFAPVAAAHGDGRDRGYRSTVTALRPAIDGVTVTVLDFDDRLRLDNRSGEVLLVGGYENEPYLRFTPDGVFVNVHSPALYENEERYGVTEIPATADPKAVPEWKRVARGTAYEWHDHRAHWMSPIPPPKVKAAPDRAHHIFDWRIPALRGDRRVWIVGSLDYRPPPDSGPNWFLIGGTAVAAAALGAGVFLLRRRRRFSRTV